MTEQESTGWWRTLPGVMTAVAGIVTAITGLIIALHETGIIGGSVAKAPTFADADAQVPLATVETRAAAGAPATVAAMPFVGSWSGVATDEKGNNFPISIEVTPACGMHRHCGTIHAPNVPCHGVLTLVGAVQDSYEFRVDNFTPESSTACSPGAGEHFRRLPNGTLLYTTTYEPRASGILKNTAN